MFDKLLETTKAAHRMTEGAQEPAAGTKGYSAEQVKMLRTTKFGAGANLDGEGKAHKCPKCGVGNHTGPSARGGTAEPGDDIFCGKCQAKLVNESHPSDTLTLRQKDGEWRVPAADLKEEGAYYTNDRKDAIATAKKMHPGKTIRIAGKTVNETANDHPFNQMRARKNTEAMAKIAKHYKKDAKDLTNAEIVKYNQRNFKPGDPVKAVEEGVGPESSEFEGALRKAMQASKERAKAEGADKMSVDNWRQITRMGNQSLKGAPQGTNAQYYFKQMFAKLAAGDPFVLKESVESDEEDDESDSIQDVWYTSSRGGIELKLTIQDLNDVPSSGPADEDIAVLVNEPRIAEQLDKVDPKAIAAELKEYGAWDDEELADEEQNRKRLLWVAIGNVKEEQYQADRQANGMTED